MYLIELKCTIKVYFRYTLNILHLKIDIIQRSYFLIVIVKYILGTILRNVHCVIKTYSNQNVIIIVYQKLMSINMLMDFKYV